MRASVCACALILGCGSSGGNTDPDTSLTDTSVTDTSVTPDTSATPDTSMPDTGGAEDAALDAPADVPTDGDCSLGVATSSATATNPSLFGEPVPVADGEDLPAGTYRIRYVDGCFKYAPSQDWTIHARLDGDFTWWLIDGSTDERLVILPGTVGIFAADTAYADFEECVAANLLVDDVLYEHTGGPLSIFLADSNYPDNTAGVDDRNPAWEFIYEDCVD